MRHINNISMWFLIISVFSMLSVSAKKRLNPVNELNLTFLHNNDMHARFDEIGKHGGPCKSKEKYTTGCYGGFARTSYLIEEFRKLAQTNKIDPVIYLNAGDTYQGTPWFNIHKWKIVTRLMNMLNPDAASLGNHEFDHSVPGLLPYLEQSTYPILAANIVFDDVPSNENMPFFKKSQVFHVQCHKIGVIGYITPETKALSSKKINVTFEEEVVAIKREIARLKRQNVRIFIGLGHSGFKEDIKIAQAVPELDLVIGGHTNNLLWNGDQPDLERVTDKYPFVVTQESTNRKVYVVQAYAHTKYLGVLNTTFNTHGEITRAVGQPILVDETKKEQCAMVNDIELFRHDVEEITLKKVGKSKVVLQALGCRATECPLGALITNSFLDAIMETQPQECPIVLVNGGGIRAPLDVSSDNNVVTHETILSILPFKKELMTAKLKGSVIKRALEHGVRRYIVNNPYGEYLHLLNIKVVYDMNNEPGARVVNMTVWCEKCDPPGFQALDLDKQYMLLTTSYLMDGGDGYIMLAEDTEDKTRTGIPDTVALENFVTKLSPLTKDLFDYWTSNSEMINLK